VTPIPAISPWCSFCSLCGGARSSRGRRWRFCIWGGGCRWKRIWNVECGIRNAEWIVIADCGLRIAEWVEQSECGRGGGNGSRVGGGVCGRFFRASCLCPGCGSCSRSGGRGLVDRDSKRIIRLSNYQIINYEVKRVPGFHIGHIGHIGH
jgi:hypothetical protein